MPMHVLKMFPTMVYILSVFLALMSSKFQNILLYYSYYMKGHYTYVMNEHIVDNNYGPVLKVLQN